ncbi:hypothetical protein D3C73_1314980 [compost metagenome]
MPGQLFELPAEVFNVLISAPGSDFRNALGVVNQVFFGHTNPAVDNVIHAGNSKRFFVDVLKITWADPKRIRHFRNRPVIARVILNGGAQFQ